MRSDLAGPGLRIVKLNKDDQGPRPSGRGTALATPAWPKRTGRPHWDRRRTAVAAAGIASFVNLYAPQSLLPTFAQVFGTDAAHASLTLTATLLAVACVAPFVGGLSDRFGRRRLIVGASLLLAVPGLAEAFAPNFEAIIVARFVQGLMLPFVFAITVAYVAEELDPAEAAQVTGIYAMFSIVGGFLGRFASGWLTELYGWRLAFVALAGLTLACAVTIARCLPHERNFRPTQGWRDSLEGFRDQFINPQVMATCVVGFAVLFSMVGTFTFVTLHLAGPLYGMGPAALGNVFIIYLAGVIATPLATRLALRIGRRWTHMAAAAVGVTGLLLSLVPGLGFILAGLSLAVAGFFAEQVLSLGHIGASARRARSTAVGLYVTSYYGGGALGSVVPAGLWRAYGWPGPVLLIVAVQAIAVLVTYAVWSRPGAARAA